MEYAVKIPVPSVPRIKITHNRPNMTYATETIILKWPPLSERPSLHRDVIVKHTGANPVIHQCDYIAADNLADRFIRSTEGIGPNSRLFEFPISAGDLAYILACTFAVTIPEAKYSRWKTIEQAINTTYSAQYTR